jgi:hypothetical protein
MDMAHGSIGHAVAIRPHPFSAPNRLLASYPFKTQPTIRASRAPCAEPGIQVPICREPALAAGMARHERVFQPVSCGPPALVGADGSLAPVATGRVTDARRGRPLAPQPAIRSGGFGPSGVRSWRRQRDRRFSRAAQATSPQPRYRKEPRCVPCAHLVSVARTRMNSDAAYLYNVRARSTSPNCRLQVARSCWHQGQAVAEPPKSGCPQTAVRQPAPRRMPATPSISGSSGSQRSKDEEGTCRRGPTSQRAGPGGSPIPWAGSGGPVRASDWTRWRCCPRCRPIGLMLPHLLSRRQPLTDTSSRLGCSA